MYLQEVLSNAVQAKRNEEMKTSEQLTLGEIILKIESIGTKEDDGSDKEVRFDFGYFMPTELASWRGSYCELAVGYSEEGEVKKAESFLTELKDAIGKTYTGYKGGDFIMGKTTPVWVSNYGESPNVAIVDVIDKGYYILLKTEHLDY